MLLFRIELDSGRIFGNIRIARVLIEKQTNVQVVQKPGVFLPAGKKGFDEQGVSSKWHSTVGFLRRRSSKRLGSSLKRGPLSTFVRLFRNRLPVESKWDGGLVNLTRRFLFIHDFTQKWFLVSGLKNERRDRVQRWTVLGKALKQSGKRGGQGVRAYIYIGISYEFQTYRFCQRSCVFFASHRQLDNGNF